LSILKVVSLEAGKTGSSGIVSGALVGNGDANVDAVEGPSVSAGKTFLAVPIPSGASKVSWGSSVGG
jgi:hypothetical protein